MTTETKPDIISIDSDTRSRLQDLVHNYAEENELIPPLSMKELEWHKSSIIDIHRIDKSLSDYILVLINNEVWSDTLATIPYDRRLLLLPKCLRSFTDCPAQIDEYGLLCEECGRCSIGKLQNIAEDLGYVVLIAEGSTVVTKLLEGGKVDAVIGISCLSALEKSFPHMASGAIPGIAIPLLYDGCQDTEADTSLIEEAIKLKSDKKWIGKIDFDLLKEEVDTWFNAKTLKQYQPSTESESEIIARDWLIKSGKRWRPLLAACAYKTITECGDSIPDSLRKLAIAVECFHKASLAHDDIEDNSELRYGNKTLHNEHGIPIALNTGDLLLGWGYNLIANSEFNDNQKARILSAAAQGHRDLCLGQGSELSWTKNPTKLSAESVINIFRLKTAPAFNVALQLGAIAGGADETLCKILSEFSSSLGIAYQIKDDIEDFKSINDSDSASFRLSLLIALVFDNASGNDKKTINSFLTSKDDDIEKLIGLASKLQVADKAQQLLAHYKNEAIRALIPLKNAHLKILLRRTVTKILGDI